MASERRCRVCGESQRLSAWTQRRRLSKRRPGVVVVSGGGAGGDAGVLVGRRIRLILVNFTN